MESGDDGDMARWLVDRLQHGRRVVRPGWLIAMAAISAYSTLQTIWPALPTNLTRGYGLILPPLPWSAWASTAAAILVIGVLEGSFRLRNELQDKIDELSGPHASLLRRQVEANEAQLRELQRANERAGITVIRRKLSAGVAEEISEEVRSNPILRSSEILWTTSSDADSSRYGAAIASAIKAGGARAGFAGTSVQTHSDMVGVSVWDDGQGAHGHKVADALSSLLNNAGVACTRHEADAPMLGVVIMVMPEEFDAG